MEWQKLGEFIITNLSEKIFKKAWVFSVFHYTSDSDLHQVSRNVAENTSVSGGGGVLSTRQVSVLRGARQRSSSVPFRLSFWQESYASRIFSISKFASLFNCCKFTVL